MTEAALFTSNGCNLCYSLFHTNFKSKKALMNDLKKKKPIGPSRTTNTAFKWEKKPIIMNALSALLSKQI